MIDPILSLTKNINHMDDTGMTPLLRIMLSNKKYSLEYIKKYDFDITLSSSLSPLSISRLINKKELESYILNHVKETKEDKYINNIKIPNRFSRELFRHVCNVFK